MRGGVQSMLNRESAGPKALAATWGKASTVQDGRVQDGAGLGCMDRLHGERVYGSEVVAFRTFSRQIGVKG